MLTVIISEKGLAFLACECRSVQAFPLSHDHKPMNPGERARIAAAGGCVTNGRVDGNLNLSRSLGDLYYKSDTFIPPEKQRITAFPDVRCVATQWIIPLKHISIDPTTLQCGDAIRSVVALLSVSQSHANLQG